MTEEMEELQDLEHVARVLMINPRTLLNFVMRGEIKAIRVGRLVRFRDEDVREYIKTHPYEPKSKESK